MSVHMGFITCCIWRSRPRVGALGFGNAREKGHTHAD